MDTLPDEIKGEILSHMDTRSIARFLGTNREMRERLRVGKYQELLDFKKKAYEFRAELARLALKDAQDETYEIFGFTFVLPPLSRLMEPQFPYDRDSTNVIIAHTESVKDWLYIYGAANNLYREENLYLIIDETLASLASWVRLGEEVDSSDFQEAVLDTLTTSSGDEEEELDRDKGKMLQVRYAAAYLMRAVEYVDKNPELYTKYLCAPSDLE